MNIFKTGSFHRIACIAPLFSCLRYSLFLLLSGIAGFVCQPAHALPVEKLQFEHLTEDDGLTNSHIHCITQDGDGFIWIGTEYGLYRYDGLQFKHFVNYPGDTSSINSNVVFKLHTDSKETLWIGTFMGLQYYDREKEVFRDLNLAERFRSGYPVPISHITQDDNNRLYVSTDLGIVVVEIDSKKVWLIPSGSDEADFQGNTVTAIGYDKNGNQWIGTEDGVDFINKHQSRIIHYNLSDFSERDFTTAFIHNIYEDVHRNIWILTRDEGVFFKAYNSTDFVQFVYYENDKYSLGSNETYDIYEDNFDRIWISTSGGGLNLYLDTPGKFQRVKHSPGNKSSLLNNNIRSILEDRQGNVWIVSYQAGINIYVNHPQIFEFTAISTDNSLEYQSSTVSSISEYKDNKFWIGTDGGGLKLYDRSTGTFKTYLPDRDVPGSFPGRVVMTIYKDINNTYWFGTYQGGLVKYQPDDDSFYAYQADPDDEYALSSNFVTCLTEDSRGNFWVGTNGGGLHLFDRNSGKFIRYQNTFDDPNSLINNFINDILEDHNGDIWIATFWGLSRYNSKDFTFTNYLSKKTESQSLSHNSVFCLFEDDKQRLWIGTRNGLNLYNYKEDNFTYYTEKDGLSGNTIDGILGDETGQLWLSTNNGLTKFSPGNAQAVNYTESDGLQGNEFYRNSRYKAEDGELFFGGINGFNSFYPEKVKTQDEIPNLVLTGMRILEQEVPIGTFRDGRQILEQNLNSTNKIKLKHSDKTFSFQISVIDFISPENNLVAYMLEGFDNSWNYTSAEFPIITYTNIGAGDYRLLLKASNKNFINRVSTQKTLAISIAPPVYKTWWAYLIYILLILSISYYLWQLSISRIQAENLVKIEKLKREKSEELNQSKFRFFTNISHEFRTPLTLIIGPLEELIRNESAAKPIQRQLDIMLVNARRMLRLINQLLDFRKLEGERMSLKAEYADIIRFVSDVKYSFEQFAVEKQITFHLKTNMEEFRTWFDPDKLDKILFNLLSNAFKFTPSKGSIELSVETDKHFIEESGEERSYTLISVSDTGLGIPESDIQNLFDRFYQAKNTNHFTTGSGLGLTLTKNFVEIHKGKIFVDSRENEGTTFRIYLPQGDSHLESREKSTSDNPGINKYIHLTPENYQAGKSDTKPQSKTSGLLNKPNLLIVEDNLELMNYLESICNPYFNFFSAANGKEGYEMATDILPDIIISDIMMPEMNGYQFCRNIKNHILTSHIPIVLLTAKSSTDDEIAGYEAGADAYIPKPFRADHLIATANALIENRNRLRERFNTGQILTNQPIRNTADDKFLQRVTDSVNNNISNLEFGVLELSKDLGISRVHLHRKLKAIANISPNEFIKNIRLQKACELLLNDEYNISEVCFRVGFNSPAYFSSCFKNQYQMSPTEYVDKHTGR